MCKQTHYIELLQTNLVDSKSTIISLKSDLAEEERRCARIQKTLNDKLENMMVNPELNLVKREVKRMKQQIQSQQHQIDDLEDDKLVTTMRFEKNCEKWPLPQPSASSHDRSPRLDTSVRPVLSQRRIQQHVSLLWATWTMCPRMTMMIMKISSGSIHPSRRTARAFNLFLGSTSFAY
jgi:hypothetical protein